MAPQDILAAVFFDIAGAPLTLIRTSAVVAPGSIVVFGVTDPGGVVGGEWAYASALAGAPSGAAYGISASGFDLFAVGDLFPGSDLSPPAAPNGLNYAITSAGDDTSTGNAAVTGDSPLIQNSVVFTLSGLPVGFNVNTAFSNVTFQYGTDFSEPRFPGIPAPGSAIAALLGVGLAARRRRA